MSTRRARFFALRLCVFGLACGFGIGTAIAQTPGLGKPITESDIAAWNIDVLPDGTGLPSGSGTARRARRSTRRSARSATARMA